MLKVPIRVDTDFKEATLEFVTKRDFGFLKQWRSSIKNDRHPIRCDSVDFAALACKRFTAHAPTEIYAQRVDDIAVHIQNNPRSEIANLVLVRCDWFEESNVIGVLHFRRSWCNNLIVDYLAAHPWSAERPAHCPTKVSGVGIAMLCFLCRLVDKLSCQAIWGEATQNSCEKYKEFFQLDSVDDLLYIERNKTLYFADAIEKKWLDRKLKWTFGI